MHAAVLDSTPSLELERFPESVFLDDELSHGALVTLNRLQAKFDPGESIPIDAIAWAGRNRKTTGMTTPDPKTREKWCRELEAAGFLVLCHPSGGGSHWTLTETPEFPRHRFFRGEKTVSPLSTSPKEKYFSPSTKTSNTAATPLKAAEPPRREAPGESNFSRNVDKPGEKSRPRLVRDRPRRRDAGPEYLDAANEVVARICAVPGLRRYPSHPESSSFTVKMMVEEFGFSRDLAVDTLVRWGTTKVGIGMDGARKRLTAARERKRRATPGEQTPEEAAADLEGMIYDEQLTGREVDPVAAEMARVLVRRRPGIQARENFLKHVLREFDDFTGTVLVEPGQAVRAAELMAQREGVFRPAWVRADLQTVISEDRAGR